ncbi:MAG: hypothetical protein GC137_04900 [Alphaproteobacteria bacterium]|nr:hypothetical protein [Alphaproteobacteria bacterium]
MFLRILAFCVMFGATAASADEFGHRFHNETPQGLADYTAETTETSAIAFDADAAALDEIAPAAGESTDTEPKDQQEQIKE